MFVEHPRHYSKPFSGKVVEFTQGGQPAVFDAETIVAIRPCGGPSAKTQCVLDLATSLQMAVVDHPVGDAIALWKAALGLGR
jgi:hypothetical protein